MSNIEYVTMKPEEECQLVGVTIKAVYEDKVLKSVYLKDQAGNSYKIVCKGSYSSDSMYMVKPKPMMKKTFKVDFKLNDEVVSENVYDTEDEAKAKKEEIYGKHSMTPGYSCEVEEEQEEIVGIIDEAI